MKQTITAKFRILPDAQQQVLLKDTMKAYLQACNHVSEYVFRTHDLKQKTINQALYYDLRARFGLPSQMAQSVIRTVIGSYRAILANHQPWIQVMYKHGFYDLVWNRDYILKADMFSINTLSGRLKLAFKGQYFEKYLDGKNTLGSAKVVCKKGKFFLHVSITTEVPDTLLVSNVVGVDRGVNFLAATYDSRGKTTFYSGKSVKQTRARYKQLRKDLQQRGTKSARRRLKMIGQRENRWMSDVNHRVSKALVESNPAGSLFVLEDLTGIRQATEKVHRKDRYVLVSWAFHDLEQKLRYKAIRSGSQVVNVDPAYTSQTCPKCGFVSRSNRDKKLHRFQCKSCGYRSNDDRVAAMNLHFKGIQYHSAVTCE